MPGNIFSFRYIILAINSKSIGYPRGDHCSQCRFSWYLLGVLRYHVFSPSFSKYISCTESEISFLSYNNTFIVYFSDSRKKPQFSFSRILNKLIITRLTSRKAKILVALLEVIGNFHHVFKISFV